MGKSVDKKEGKVAKKKANTDAKSVDKAVKKRKLDKNEDKPAKKLKKDKNKVGDVAAEKTDEIAKADTKTKKKKKTKTESEKEEKDDLLSTTPLKNAKKTKKDKKAKKASKLNDEQKEDAGEEKANGIDAENGTETQAEHKVLKEVNQVDVDDNVDHQEKEEADGNEGYNTSTGAPAAHLDNDVKTCFVRNLSFDATEEDILEAFKDFGAYAVRISKDFDTGRSRGYCHVDFQTSEEAHRCAEEANGYEITGRSVSIEIAAPRQPRESGAGGGGGGATIFVKNFDKYGSEDDIRQSLGDFFSQCGSVLDIRIPTERETGSIKGFAFIKFETEEAKQEAINLNGSELNGRRLIIDGDVDGTSNSSGGQGGGWRGGGGRGGGRRGGRGGGGGGRGDRGRGMGRGGRGFRGGGRGDFRGGRNDRGRGRMAPRGRGLKIDIGGSPSMGKKITFD